MIDVVHKKISILMFEAVGGKSKMKKEKINILNYYVFIMR